MASMMLDAYACYNAALSHHDLESLVLSLVFRQAVQHLKIVTCCLARTVKHAQRLVS